MSTNVHILLASLIDQSKTRLDVVFDYLMKNPELMDGKMYTYLLELQEHLTDLISQYEDIEKNSR